MPPTESLSLKAAREMRAARANADSARLPSCFTLLVGNGGMVAWRAGRRSPHVLLPLHSSISPALSLLSQVLLMPHAFYDDRESRRKGEGQIKGHAAA